MLQVSNEEGCLLTYQARCHGPGPVFSLNPADSVQAAYSSPSNLHWTGLSPWLDLRICSSWILPGQQGTGYPIQVGIPSQAEI